jgi:hypothetical protein
MYGPLVDLIQVPEPLMVATEVVAMNRVFEVRQNIDPIP